MAKLFWDNNRGKLAEKLEEGSVVVLFAGEAPYKRGDEQYPFAPDRNFYYVTGIEREQCIFFLGKAKGEMTAKLFIPRDNGEMAKWVGANLTQEEASEFSGIENIAYLDQFFGDLTDFILRKGISHIYLDMEQRTWNGALSPALQFAQQLREKYPAMILRDVYPVFGTLRVVKEAYEIERIREAVAITEEGLRAMMLAARPGMMEYEIEAHFDFVLKQKGVRQNAFQSIIAAGKNGTTLHYMENNGPTKEGDLLLCDVGAAVGWYHGDLTRTFPVSGKFSERQKMVYDIVLAGQAKVIEAVEPGRLFTELNTMLIAYYAEELQKIGLISAKEEVSRYYFHGVSHYLGAETHDIGRYGETTLRPGMVLTVEPGLYIPEWEIGIRIEDDVLVTEEGREVLSGGLIKTTEEIEAFMAEGRK